MKPASLTSVRFLTLRLAAHSEALDVRDSTRKENDAFALVRVLVLGTHSVERERRLFT